MARLLLNLAVLFISSLMFHVVGGVSHSDFNPGTRVKGGFDAYREFFSSYGLFRL